MTIGTVPSVGNGNIVEPIIIDITNGHTRRKVDRSQIVVNGIAVRIRMIVSLRQYADRVVPMTEPTAQDDDIVEIIPIHIPYGDFVVAAVNDDKFTVPYQIACCVLQYYLESILIITHAQADDVIEAVAIEISHLDAEGIYRGNFPDGIEQA